MAPIEWDPRSRMKGGISKSTVHRGGDEYYVIFLLGYENEMSLFFANDFTGRDTS